MAVTIKKVRGRPYHRVYYRDENGRTKEKTYPFDAKGKAEAKTFDKTIRDTVRVLKKAKADRRPLQHIVSDMAAIGLVNSVPKTFQQIEDLPNAREKSIATLVDQFLKACEVGRDGRIPLKRSTVESYTKRLKPFKARFGARKPTEITKQDMRDYRDALVETCGTRTHAKNVFSMAVIFFAYLVDELEILDRTPAKGVRFNLTEQETVHTVTESEIYTEEEVDKLLASALSYTAVSTHGKRIREGAFRDRAILYLLIFCGMRIGEVLALRREEIDLAHRLIQVTNTLNRWQEVTMVKTAAGRRQVIVPTAAVQPIADWLKLGNGEFAFTTASGEFLSYRNFYRSWDRLVKAAKVPQRRNIHSLRHYYASKLISAGYDEDRITRMIGHEDINFTKKVYGHLLDRRTRLTKDVNDIDDVFRL